MGKKINVKIKKRIAPDTTYDGTELTDVSPRLTRKSMVLDSRAAYSSFRVVNTASGQKDVIDKATGAIVARISKRHGQWSYKLRNGDGKIHMTGCKMRDALAVIAEKVKGLQS